MSNPEDIPISEQATLLGGKEIMHRVGILHSLGRPALEAYIASYELDQVSATPLHITTLET